MKYRVLGAKDRFIFVLSAKKSLVYPIAKDSGWDEIAISTTDHKPDAELAGRVYFSVVGSVCSGALCQQLDQ